VVGDREQEQGAVSVRQREEGDLGSMALADLAARMKVQGRPSGRP
jgi:threonyl-tRNA synthetase